MGDERRGRVAAAGDHDEAEAEDVPVGKAFPFDLGGDQGADQVVGGFASACFDLLAEVAEHLGHRTLAVELSDAQAVVLDGGERLHPGPEAVAVLLGEAEELGEHVGGDRAGELLVQVDVLAVGGAFAQLGQPAAGEVADDVFEFRHPSRREPASDQRPALGVHRRVEHHQVGWEIQLVDLVRVERQALGRREVLLAAHRVPDVGEA